MRKRIVVLTGANRGLGRTTAEILVKNYSQNHIYIFTQRTKDHSELQEVLLKINPQAEVDFKDLDISNKENRDEFQDWLSSKYKKFDVLYNNAGVFDKRDKLQIPRPVKEIAEKTLATNLFGTVEFTEQLFPLLSDDAKIIQITGIAGQLKYQPKEAQALLNDDTLTKQKIYQLAQNYIENSSDTTKDLIFSTKAYYTSKALLNAYIRYVAVKYIKPQQSVYSVHPGWVKTDMGGEEAPMTKENACPFLAKIVAQFPYERHPLSGKFQFIHKEIAY